MDMDAVVSIIAIVGSAAVLIWKLGPKLAAVAAYLKEICEVVMAVSDAMADGKFEKEEIQKVLKELKDLRK